jgi:hypothetical protein
MKQKYVEIIKTAASELPVLGQFLASWDKYKQNHFNENVGNILDHLNAKIHDLDNFFRNEWLHSKDGQLFTKKVLDSALDSQLADKQELFINALINGIEDQEMAYREKLKFVDMLRHLSRPSLDVLAEMHRMFKDQVKRPGNNDPVQRIPRVEATRIAEQLGSKFHPYLVTSSIHEMTSQGLFDNIAEWIKTSNGTYRSGAGFANALAYTEFTYRFGEIPGTSVTFGLTGDDGE